MFKSKKAIDEKLDKNKIYIETYKDVKKPTRKEINEAWNKTTDLINNLLVIKKRYLSINLLRKIIVLDSLINEENVAEELFNERGEKWLEYMYSDAIPDYNPEHLDGLLEKLKVRKKGEVIINITPKWIKKVILAYYKLFDDPKYQPDGKF